MSEQETAAPRRAEYLGEPTLGQIMRRPRWILGLLLALAIAAGFAMLGQWQMSHAIRAESEQQVDTETPRSLAEVANTATGVTDLGAGVVVTLAGTCSAGDFRVVEPRQNGGEMGAWVVARAITAGGEAEAGANLAVAVGWAPSVADAEQAIDVLDAGQCSIIDGELSGRLMPPEGPKIPKASEAPQVMHTMMPAFLANSWSDVTTPVYSGYLVLHPDEAMQSSLSAAGLDPIDSVAPLAPEQVNWLNVFYAVEWVVFAGFAIFFWFRLTRDAWEKEHEWLLLQAAAAVDPDPSDHPQP